VKRSWKRRIALSYGVSRTPRPRGDPEIIRRRAGGDISAIRHLSSRAHSRLPALPESHHHPQGARRDDRTFGGPSARHLEPDPQPAFDPGAPAARPAPPADRELFPPGPDESVFTPTIADTSRTLSGNLGSLILQVKVHVDRYRRLNAAAAGGAWDR